MQKVRILAESITNFSDLIECFALTLELGLPLFVTVVRSGALEPIEDTFVVVGDAGDFLDTNCPIQRRVRVQAVRVRLERLFKLTSSNAHVLRFLQIYLKHFSEKDSVLILNFTHTFYINREEDFKRNSYCNQKHKQKRLCYSYRK
jgi:hypothetical protein